RLGQGAGTCPDDAVTLGALETLPMALLGRWMNWNMRHNQSYLTARERRSNTPVQFIASLPAGGARRSFRFVPQAVDFGRRHRLEIESARCGDAGDFVESHDELAAGGAQRLFGIHADEAGRVGNREHQVADLLGGAGAVAAIERMLDLLDFF